MGKKEKFDKVVSPKREGFNLEIKTFKGKSGFSYLVMKTRKGSYNVFIQVEAKGAADDCGGKGKTTVSRWDKLWKK